MEFMCVRKVGGGEVMCVCVLCLFVQYYVVGRYFVRRQVTDDFAVKWDVSSAGLQ